MIFAVFTTSYVVCRPTAKDAQDYQAYYADKEADWPAVDRLMELQGVYAKSFPPEAFKLFRNRFAAGHESIRWWEIPIRSRTNSRRSARRDLPARRLRL
jgi:hypothetical protein